jgi:hypothetical protein
MKENKKKTMADGKKEEKGDRFLVWLDCDHKHVLSAAEFAKPARHDLHGNRYYLCRDCYTRKDGACSIDPVHKLLDMKVIGE